jgi:hypothetical protein
MRNELSEPDLAALFSLLELIVAGSAEEERKV